MAPGHSWSWISQLCTKACTIVCFTMPGSVHHSAVCLRKSSRLVATMAIHPADLIAVQECSLSSVMLENRSCSWSSYLGDGCWQPTQALCTSSCFFFLSQLLIFYFLCCTSLTSPLLLSAHTPPPVSTPLSALCFFSACKSPCIIHDFCSLSFISAIYVSCVITVPSISLDHFPSIFPTL